MPLARRSSSLHVLDLARVEHAARSLGRRRLLQIADEIADILLELGERAERIDLEHGHEAAVIVPAGRLDAEAEPGQQAAQDLDHDRETGALVAAVRAAQRQQRAALAQLARIVGRACRRRR